MPFFFTGSFLDRIVREPTPLDKKQPAHGWFQGGFTWHDTGQEAFTYSFPDNSFFNSWKGASSEKKSGLNVFLGEKGLL